MTYAHPSHKSLEKSNLKKNRVILAKLREDKIKSTNSFLEHVPLTA